MVKTRTRFADELKLNAIEIWNNILSHKFINEISTDTLPLNKFLFYLRQDHIFLNIAKDLTKKNTDCRNNGITLNNVIWIWNLNICDNTRD
jgi:hypothetical protein